MRWCIVLIVGALIAGCTATETDIDPREAGGAAVTNRIDLPQPDTSGGGSLADALSQRRSIREYEQEPLEMREISQLLWSAQGITSDRGGRTAPSAGALYPLELYLVTPAGRYHYDPIDHQLEVLGEGDLRADLSRAALSQESIAQAPAIFVFTAVFSRTEQKYGERAATYVKIEVGHAAQNLLLQAVSLGLGAVPIGAFHDDEVAEVLNLPADHQPLYLIPVGHPNSAPGSG